MSKVGVTQKWKLAAIVLASLLIIFFGVLETTLYFLDDRFRHGGYFRVPPVSLKNLEEEANAFFKGTRFDPDLGWDNRPPVQNYIENKVFLAQAYGDSFTLSGHGGITWQEAFENITGKGILNFGVGGYGLDQAVLKFEKYSSEYSTPIAILGLFGHTFRRALSFHSRYYFGNYDDWTFAFKPFFVEQGSQYELIMPPCKDTPCLLDVLNDSDNEVRKIQSSHDYWYGNDREKPALRFPRIPKYAQVLPAIWRYSRWGQRSKNYYFVNNKSLELTKYLVQRFVLHAEKNGMIPICLLLHSSKDLKDLKGGQRYLKSFMDFLKEKQIRYIDTKKHILERYEQDDDFLSLSVPDGHLNNRGDQLVAGGLAQGLAELGLLKTIGKL